MSWVKFAILGAIAATVLIGVIVIYQQSQIETEESSSSKEKTLEGFGVNKVHDLDDQDILQSLSIEGLGIQSGNTVHFKIIENATTGFMWILEPGMCEGILKISDSFDAPTTGEDEI